MVNRAFVRFTIIDATEAAFTTAIELTDKANTVWIVSLGGDPEQLCIMEATAT